MPAPANDNFASATTISGASGTQGGDTKDATMEGSESTTIGTNMQSVWYTFTAPSTGWFKFWIPTHTYNGIFGSDNATLQLRVFPDGVLTAMTQTNAIAGTASFSFNGAEINGMTCAAFLTSGSVYKIRVASYKSSGTTNTGTCTFDLSWAAISAPANDAYASAIDVGAVPVSETGINNEDATAETSEPLHSGGFYDAEQSVWYKFTPAVTGTYRFRALGASLNYEGTAASNPGAGSVYVEIGTGASAAAFTWTAGNFLSLNVVFPIDSLKDITLTSGTTYYIRVVTPYVYKAGDFLEGFNAQVVSFDLEIEYIAPPANDDFANAETLSPTLPGSTSGTTDGATPEGSESSVWSSDRSVWYKITPTTTGLYRFVIPIESFITDGTGTPEDGSLAMYIWPSSVTALVDADSGAELDNDFFYNDPTWSQAGRDGVVMAQLTSGQTYYLKVLSPWNGTNPNRFTAAFDLEYDIVTPPSNDDFANRDTISGASGTEDFSCMGSTSEASEPDPMYWNGGFFEGTVWFEWTAPSTGWFKFKVESREFNPSMYYEMGIWTGTTLAGLTKVCRGSGNSQGVAPNDLLPTTALGFHATSGTVYKIQVQQWGSKFGGDSRLTWSSIATPTGDSTATAVSLPLSGLVDVYGNDDSEPPPNFVSLLSAHDEWWYDDGQVGHVKWYKFVAGSTQTVSLKGIFWDGDDPEENYNYPKNVFDIGLIAYKGANYGSLTVATTTAALGTKNVAMLAGSNVFAHGDNQGRALYIDPPTGNDITDVEIDVTAGQTLWLCIFGLYDADPGTADAIADSGDASQFNLSLTFTSAQPVNDTAATTPGYPTYAYALNRSWYGNGVLDAHAGQLEGTTFGATADAGESANAGYGPTRTVWYTLDIYDPGDYKIWVESSEDCVLGLYNFGVIGDTPSYVGTKVDDDDDSGTGNWPEITATLTNDSYWVVVDSKTEGNFVVKFQKVPTGTPPANDDFADAVTIAVGTPLNGTTVDASAEPEEKDAVELGFGPKDTVWYKYVASSNGQLTIKATCNTNNEDAYVYIDTWKGTTLANLVRHPDPPPTGPGGGIYRGFFSFFDTAAELEAASVKLPIDNGETYYIRVQTESGGSEDFTIYLDVDSVYLNLQASGSEEFHGTMLDDATVYLDLTVSSVEVFRAALTTDAATVYFDLQPSGTEFKAFQYTDSATVYANIQVVPEDDCYFHLEPSFTADGIRKWQYTSTRRWSYSGTRRWTWIEGEGLPQIC